jgi:hypothetical protein
MGRFFNGGKLFFFIFILLSFPQSAIPFNLNDIPIILSQSFSSSSSEMMHTSSSPISVSTRGIERKGEGDEEEENEGAGSSKSSLLQSLDENVPRSRLTGQPLIRLGPAGLPENDYALPDQYEYLNTTASSVIFSKWFSVEDLGKITTTRRPRRLDCFAANVTSPKKGDVWQTTETHYVRWNAECGDEGNEDEPTFNYVCLQLRYLDAKTNTWYAAGGEGGLGTIAQLDGKYNQLFAVDVGKYMPIGLDSGTFMISLRDSLCAFKIANSETFTIKTYAAIPLNIPLIVGLSSMGLILLCVLSCYCSWRRCKPGCCWFDDPLSLYIMRKYAEHLKHQEEVRAARRLREEEERDLRERRKLEFKMREASKMRFGQWGAPGFEPAPLPEALKYSVARLKAQEALTQARETMEVINVRGVAEILLSEEDRRKLMQQRKSVSDKDVDVTVDVGETEGLLSKSHIEEEEEDQDRKARGALDANSSVIELKVLTIPPKEAVSSPLGTSLPPLAAAMEDDSLLAARARLAAARRSSRVGSEGKGSPNLEASSPLDPSVFGADRLRVSPTSWDQQLDAPQQLSSSFATPAEAALFGEDSSKEEAKDSKEGEFMFDSAAPADDTPPVQPVVMLGSRRTSQGGTTTSSLLGHHLPILGGGLQGSRRASAGGFSKVPFPPLVDPPSSPRAPPPGEEEYTEEEREALRAIEEAERAEREALEAEADVDALAERIRLNELEAAERQAQTELFKSDAQAARDAAAAAKAKSEEEIVKAHKAAAEARAKAEADMQAAREAAAEAKAKAEADMHAAKQAADEARAKAEAELAATLAAAAESTRLAEEAERKRIQEAEARAQARAEALAVAAKARAEAEAKAKADAIEAAAAKERARAEAEEARKRAEEEAKAKIELDAAHARRIAEEEAVRKAKEDAENARLAAEEAATAAALASKLREEEEERARLVAQENKRKAELAAKKKAEAEAAAAAADAEARREAEAKAEMERTAAAEAKRIAEAEMEAAALAAAEAQARSKKEAEDAHRAAEEAKARADLEISAAHQAAMEAKAKAEEEARLVQLAIQEAKKKAQEDVAARMAAFESAQKAREEQEALEIAMEEERQKAEEESKRKAEEDAALEAVRVEEEEKARLRKDELEKKEAERHARIEMERSAAAAAKSRVEAQAADAKVKADALDLSRKVEEEERLETARKADEELLLENDAFGFASTDIENKVEELQKQERLRSRIPEPKRRVSKASSTGSSVPPPGTASSSSTGARVPSRRSSRRTSGSGGDKLPTGIPLPSGASMQHQQHPQPPQQDGSVSAPATSSTSSNNNNTSAQYLPLLRRLDSPDEISAGVRSLSPSPIKESIKTIKPTLDLGEGSIMELRSIADPPKPGRYPGLSMDGSYENLPSPTEGGAAYLGKQYASESPVGSVYSTYTEDDRLAKKGKLGLVRMDHEEGESEGGAFWHLGLDASRSDASPRLLDSRGSLGGRQGVDGSGGDFHRGGTFYDEEGGVPMLTDDLFDHLADVIDEAQGDLLAGKGASQKQWKEQKARMAEEEKRKQLDDQFLRNGPRGGASSIGSVDMLMEEEELVGHDGDDEDVFPQAANIGMKPYQGGGPSTESSTVLQAPVVVGGFIRSRPNPVGGTNGGGIGSSAFGAAPQTSAVRSVPTQRPLPQQPQSVVVGSQPPSTMARPIAVAQPMAVPVASRPGPGAAAPNVNSSARAIAQPTGGATRRPSGPSSAATQQQQRPSAVAAAAPSGGVVRPAPAMPSGPPPSRPVAQAAQSVAKGGGKAPPAKKSK